MTDHDPELVVLLKKLRYDLTGMQVKVSEALRQAAALNLEPPNAHKCGNCGLLFRSAAKLAEHHYVSHDGPLPAHYDAIEKQAADDEAAELKKRGEERNAA